MIPTASNAWGNIMDADKPIAEAGRGGRAVRILQDANGHFYVEHDGVQPDEALHQGTKSDAVMRAEGYRPVVEVYPELQERPLALPGMELDELYVSVSAPRC
jgi:hypothetical protein